MPSSVIIFFLGGGKKHAVEVTESNASNNRLDGVAGANNNNIRGDCEAINRVKAKLCGSFLFFLVNFLINQKILGRDFNQYHEISVSEQVSRLIEQATVNDNLCQCYIGWCPFW